MPVPPDTMGFTHVRLPESTFAAIASGDVGPDSVRLLLDAQLSRRLPLLQHLITTCRESPSLLGPLAPIDDVQRLLDAVQDHDPLSLNTVLATPNTGMWLAHAVRLTEGVTTATARPRWVHLGMLGALAAVVALDAGIDFTVRVPLEHGSLLLPGLGRVEVAPNDRRDRTATLRARSGKLTVSAESDRTELALPLRGGQPRWTPIPVLRSGRLTVEINPIDPAPQLAGLPEPVRLPDVDLARWGDRIADAWRLLETDHPGAAAAIGVGLSSVVPLPGGKFRPIAGSSADGFGAAAIALPDESVDLACALVHEFMHSVLNGLIQLVDMLPPDAGAAVHYAPWRDDPRPLPGMVHGAYAFSAVTDFWRVRTLHDTGDAARRAELEFAVWRAHTTSVLDELADDTRLPPWGARMISLLHGNATRWTAHPVDPRTLRIARLAVESHRSAWRSRHARVRPEWVREAAQAWLTGTPAPAPGPVEIIAAPGPHHLGGVLALARLDHARSYGPVATAAELALAHDTSGADRFLALGDSGTATTRYLARIAAAPDDPHPWGGLGTALADSAAADDSPATRMLRQYPERVRALYRELRARDGRAPDVVSLAEWLGGAGTA